MTGPLTVGLDQLVQPKAGFFGYPRSLTISEAFDTADWKDEGCQREQDERRGEEICEHWCSRCAPGLRNVNDVKRQRQGSSPGRKIQRASCREIADRGQPAESIRMVGPETHSHARKVFDEPDECPHPPNPMPEIKKSSPNDRTTHARIGPRTSGYNTTTVTFVTSNDHGTPNHIQPTDSRRM